jgi:lipopolysaccharide transport system ATP-binding protein
VNDNSFKNRAGRKPGEEDVTSHYRKGVSGDWQNHFTDNIKAAFKEKFGQILIDTGYEKDMNW